MGAARSWPDVSTSQRDAAITPGPSITALLSRWTAMLPALVSHSAE